MVYLLLIIGFILLIKGADFFVEGSSNIAKALKVPTVIIGLTLVAFGTSAPEAAVSITAKLNNSSDLSVSNLIGSNIFNILVVLGFTSIFKDVVTEREVIKKDYRISLLSAILLFILVMINYFIKGSLLISRISGLVLLVTLAFYLFTLLKGIKNEDKKVEPKNFSLMDLIFTIGGIVLIIFGGQLTVNSATEIARMWGLSERVIGLTVVAIGTSLPELCTSIVALIKGENEIAVGNVVGSNIFNILFILGISSTISPILLSIASLVDLSILIIGSIIVYFLFNDLKINRKEGLGMLLLYAIYCIYILMR